MEEIIDNFLLGRLNEADHKAVQEKIDTDANFAKQVAVQKDLMEASKLTAMRSAVAKASKAAKFTKVLKTIAVTSLGVAIALSAAYFLLKYSNKEKEEQNNSPVSLFEIDNSRDTVLETSGGIILHIPAHAFKEEEVKLEVKEALNTFDILDQGLSTTSNGELLATAGMFKVAGYSNGKELTLNKAITAQIPTAEIDPDMMHFEGEENEQGEINWVKPKKIKKNLLTVPFDNLDFYPPNYLKTIDRFGVDISNKKATDSVYYSFECYSIALPTTDTSIIIRNDQIFYKRNLVSPGFAAGAVNYLPQESDGLFSEEKYSATLVAEAAAKAIRAICPASIQALRTPKFANTFIATKAFEKRLKHIFETCNESLLNVYINKLGQELWVSDSIVASMLSGRKQKVFQRFARQKLGNTRDANPAFAKLSQYHKRKKQAYASALRKTKETQEKQWRDKLNKLNNTETERNAKRTLDESMNYQKELNTNLKEAYRQAGLPYPTPVPKGNSYYNVSITTSNWNNLDKYVIQSTNKRETLDVTFKEQKVKIEYYELRVSVKGFKKYDYVRCYLIPDSLPSYQKMKSQGSSFTEKLNELFSYELVCIGKQKDKCFLYSQALENKKQKHTVSLNEKSKAEIESFLNSLNISSSSWQLLKELEYEDMVLDMNRLRSQRESDQSFRQQVEQVIWPCLDTVPLALSCDNETLIRGQSLFEAKCASCHAKYNKVVGPALFGVVDKYKGDLRWLIDFSRNNEALRASGDRRAIQVYEEYAGLAMNVFEDLSEQDVLAILSYLDCPIESVEAQPVVISCP